MTNKNDEILKKLMNYEITVDGIFYYPSMDKVISIEEDGHKIICQHRSKENYLYSISIGFTDENKSFFHLSTSQENINKSLKEQNA